MTDAGATDPMRLGDATYVLLTTFRRDGTAVPTPVWVAPDAGALLVWTAANSGKVKRIRHDATVSVAPCTARGRPTGPAVAARATVEDGSAAVAAIKRKYRVQGRLYIWLSQLRRGTAGTVSVRIVLSPPAAA
jgi:PPOX class probable F420-dependent enzyme